MRVISGTYRSRRLTAPPGTATRPTSDRLRETLFNILAPRISGAVFADLYAGSGANGIEAISRGANYVYFVETGPPAIEAIRANLKSLDIQSRFSIERRPVSAFLRKLDESQFKLDVVFLDPPYDQDEEYAATLNLLGGGCVAVLDSDSVIVAEHRRKLALEDRYGALVRHRVREQGDSALSFFAAELPISEFVPQSGGRP